VRSWLPVAEGSPFTLANLPYGVAGGHVVVAVGDAAVDLAVAATAGLLDAPPELFEGGSLNRFLEAGPATWHATRARLTALLGEGCDDLRRSARRDRVVVARDQLDLVLPVEVGDYVDGYGGLYHADTMGRILRPGTDPLPANWRHLPVGYHGRTGTLVVSGTEVVRPQGQVPAGGVPVLRPTRELDVELELGAVVGVGNRRGQPVPVADAARHLFGYVLVNDWSARDIQAFEYQPLGPFLGKSFATSLSAWVVPAAALHPHLVTGLAATAAPEPLPYLRGDPAVPGLHLEMALSSATMRDRHCVPYRLAAVELADALYWTPAQQVAHATVNGATIRPGDLFATGTLSGPDRRTQAGSLIERTWRGAGPLELPTGERRAFLEDGDTVTMTGWVGDGDARVGFGELTGTVVAASCHGDEEG
jgi:fumarylacetoacetase